MVLDAYFGMPLSSSSSSSSISGRKSAWGSRALCVSALGFAPAEATPSRPFLCLELPPLKRPVQKIEDENEFEDEDDLVAAFVGPYRSTCYFAALCHLRSRSAQSISDSHCIRYDSSHRYRRLSRHIGLEWLRQSNPRRRSLGSNRGNTKDRQNRSALARSQISLGERRAPYRRRLVERGGMVGRGSGRAVGRDVITGKVTSTVRRPAIGD